MSQLLATQHAEPVEAARELLVLAERSDVEAAAVTHALLKHCEAGTLAAPCVLRALADVASAAPTATVPLLKAELLPRLLPMLGSVRRLPNTRRSLSCVCLALPPQAVCPLSTAVTRLSLRRAPPPPRTQRI